MTRAPADQPPAAQRELEQPFTVEPGQRKIRSFVLRQGRFTPAQQRAFDALWPRFGIDYEGRYRYYNVIFGRDAPQVLEIGFGNGEALRFAAQHDRTRDYIGIEVHAPGVGRLLNGLDEDGSDHVRVYRHDAVEVLEHEVPDGSLDEIRIYFPDPWHKKRHHKRRLIQPDFAALLTRKLRNGGRLHLATDWAEYAEHMWDVLDATPGLRNCAGPRGHVPRPEWRPQTHFETRGQKLGHGVWDLLYEKIDDRRPYKRTSTTTHEQKHEPNRFSLAIRSLLVMATAFCLMYAVAELAIGQTLLVGKRRSSILLSGIPTIMIALAAIVLALLSISTIIDHYDTRQNETSYQLFRKRASRIAISLVLCAPLVELVLAFVRISHPGAIPDYTGFAHNSAFHRPEWRAYADPLQSILKSRAVLMASLIAIALMFIAVLISRFRGKRDIALLMAMLLPLSLVFGGIGIISTVHGVLSGEASLGKRVAFASEQPALFNAILLTRSVLSILVLAMAIYILWFLFFGRSRMNVRTNSEHF